MTLALQNQAVRSILRGLREDRLPGCLLGNAAHRGGTGARSLHICAFPIDLGSWGLGERKWEEFRGPGGLVAAGRYYPHLGTYMHIHQKIAEKASSQFNTKGE